MTDSPGQRLRAKREAMQLSLEQASKETSIRIHFLQAIEDDRMGAISSQVQWRGFARLYASYLGLDPHQVMEAGEKQEDTPAVEDKNEVAPENGESKPEAPKRGSVVPRPSKELPVEEEVDKKSTALFKAVGAELKRQRETLGLSLADVERQIKIRELYLHALENGMIADLPSTVQGRGMLNNYAAFMNLDPEALQMDFAEGLQLRRLERTQDEQIRKKNPEIRKTSAPITGWRRYLTPDVLIGGGLFIILFVVVIWGALQVIGSASQDTKPTADSIVSILVASDTPAAETGQPDPEDSLTTTPAAGEMVNTASVDLLATITAIGNNPIQVVVVANQRALLKVITDGKETFNARSVPGNVYTFTASYLISLITGDASAFQIYYNQQDLGIMGGVEQPLSLDFSTSGMVTATPLVTSMPTATNAPTYTPQPSSTATITPTPTLPTITPYRP